MVGALAVRGELISLFLTLFRVMVAVRWSASVVVSGKLLELYRGVLAAELLDIQE